MTATTSMTKPRASRTHKPKMPAAIAHQLDIARAARLGIDISYMAPDERCKYPSKFCCNIRVRKSTGKLHRFCEDHRLRANVNQKRWAQVRRRHHEMATPMIATQANGVLSPDCVALANATLSPGGLESDPKDLGWLLDDGIAPRATCAATASADLSDEEVHILKSILLCDTPQEYETLNGGDASLLASLLDAETSLELTRLAGRGVALVDTM